MEVYNEELFQTKHFCRSVMSEGIWDKEFARENFEEEFPLLISAMRASTLCIGETMRKSGRVNGHSFFVKKDIESWIEEILDDIYGEEEEDKTVA
jgi:hypothetical protein